MTLTVDLVQVGQDRLAPLMAFLQSPSRVHRVMAAGARPVVENHFRQLSQTNRNPYGARSSFWARMLSGVTSGADEAAAWVRMPREVALRYFGGTVTPKTAKNLAIPANAEAYGKSPRDFSDLRFEILGRGGPALVRNSSVRVSFRTNSKTGKQTTVKGAARSGGEVMFWLRPKATIQANSDVLPSDTALLEGARGGVLDALMAYGATEGIA